MRRIGLIVLSIFLCKSAEYAHAADKNIWPVAGNPQSADNCRIARTDDELEAALASVGWKYNGNNYPGVNWAANDIAVVVTTKNPGATMSEVTLFSEKSLFVKLTSPSLATGSGIFVVELEAQYAAASQCQAGLTYVPRVVGTVVPAHSGGYVQSSSTTTTLTAPAWAAATTVTAIQVRGGRTSGTALTTSGP